MPWNIRQIQLVRVPKARRWNATDPDTHRCTALRYVDDEVTFEADRISNLPSLRGRFNKPVALGIFVFGASGRSREEENEPDDGVPQSRHYSDDIKFEGRPVDRHLRSAVVRMHHNYGHPDQAVFVRALS